MCVCVRNNLRRGLDLKGSGSTGVEMGGGTRKSYVNTILIYEIPKNKKFKFETF